LKPNIFQVAAAFSFSLNMRLIVASKSIRSSSTGSGAAPADQADSGAAARAARPVDTVVPGGTGDQSIRNREAPVTEPHLA
jgi:hypothetical protein